MIGSITADILRSGNAAGESALGDVIADVQLAATAPVGFGEAQIAFMNPGGSATTCSSPRSPVLRPPARSRTKRRSRSSRSATASSR